MRNVLAGALMLGTVAGLSRQVPVGIPSGVRLPSGPAAVECGGGVQGTPGVVTIFLTDKALAPHWQLRIESQKLPLHGLESAGPGTAKVVATINGHEASCEATSPSPFHLRTTLTDLAGSTLRILARAPLEIELVDIHGRRLASRSIDPTSPGVSSVGW